MRRLRIGMVGGGAGAFIGAVHRAAIGLTDNVALVAGALCSDRDRALSSGAAIGLAPGRTYGSFEDMLAGEAALDADDRIEALAIVTPNHLHAPMAIAALEAGLHVMCEKPLAERVERARAIDSAARRAGKCVAVAHTYQGYPLVRQARALVANDELGALRRVIISYTQDWLGTDAAAASKQAQWRLDPARAGAAGAFGDIGTHAIGLVEFVTGQRIARVCAHIGALPGRTLDDDGACLFELALGAKGTLTASQVCTGDINELSFSIYGERASLHWRQMRPNTLKIARRDRPDEIWHAGNNRPYLGGLVRESQRTPAGHPEGYIEAFANLYQAFAADALSGRAGAGRLYPTLEDGFACMAVVDAVLASNRQSAWVEVERS